MSHSTLLAALLIGVFLVGILVLWAGCRKRSANQQLTPEGHVLISSDESPYSRAMMAGDYAAAERLAMELLEREPRTHDAYIALGHALFLQREYNRAAEQYERAIELSPRSIQALYGRGLVAQEEEQFEAAREFYERALRIDPNYPDAHFGMAAACEGLGIDRLVIVHAKRFLVLVPDSPLANQAREMISLAEENAGKVR